MHSFYAVFEDLFGANVRLLYTDTYLFVLQLFFDALKKALTKNPALQSELDVCCVAYNSQNRLSKLDYTNSGDVGKFKEELNLDIIMQVFGKRPKIY